MIIEYFQILWKIVSKSAPYLLVGLLVAGILKIFVPQEFLLKHLGRRGIGSNFKAALFGIPLPLCSCGVLPTAVSLFKRGVNLPATFAFLVATPQTSVDAILLAYGLLGISFALAYPASALFAAFFTSLLMLLFLKEDQRSSREVASCPVCESCESHEHGFGEKLSSALRHSLDEVFSEIATPLLVGFLVAALVTLVLPPQLAEVLKKHNLAYPAMLLIGLPIYVCATASIPLGYALLLKGFSLGSVLVFLMAGPGTNLTSLVVLSRVFGRDAVVLYLGSLVAAAVISGVVLDAVSPKVTQTTALLASEEDPSSLNLLASFVLGILFVRHYAKRLLSPPRKNPEA